MNRKGMTAQTLIGSVYILHYERPLGNPDNARAMAQHYTGFAENLEERLEEHRTGNYAGKVAKLPKAFQLAGIGFTVAHLETGVPQAREYQFKRKIKNARHACPICRAELAKAREVRSNGNI